MVPPLVAGGGLPAVLRSPHDGATPAEEAEDRSSIGRTLQETQHRHGEQNHAAAAQDRRAGNHADNTNHRRSRTHNLSKLLDKSST